MKEKEKIDENAQKRSEWQAKRSAIPVFEFVPTDVSGIATEREKAFTETAGMDSLAERASIIGKFTEQIIELMLADAERHRTEMESYAEMVDAHQKWIDAELVAIDADDDLLYHTINQQINESLDAEVQSYANTETPAQDSDGLIDHLLLAGFGETKQKQLADAGVKLWSDIAKLTVAEVNAIIKPDAASKRVQEWIDFAKNRLA